MKLFIDENIPRMTVRALSEMGHDVLDIRGTSEEGLPDDLLWDKVQFKQQMVDFASLSPPYVIVQSTNRWWWRYRTQG